MFLVHKGIKVEISNRKIPRKSSNILKLNNIHVNLKGKINYWDELKRQNLRDALKQNPQTIITLNAYI